MPTLISVQCWSRAWAGIRQDHDITTGLLFFFSFSSHPCVDKENGKTHKDDKSIFRKCWEVYHAVSGLISIAIGIGQVIS